MQQPKKLTMMIVVALCHLVIVLGVAGVMAFATSEPSVFMQIFLFLMGLSYGSILVYALGLWLLKPLTKLSDNDKAKITSVAVEIGANVLLLCAAGVIGWLIYESVKDLLL